jgi:hypothetical protein
MSRRSITSLAALSIAAASFLAAPTITVAAPSIVSPKILSADWGLNNANACPTGEKGLDNIPVTFNWFINPTTIAVTDFCYHSNRRHHGQPHMRTPVPTQ